MLVRNTCQGLGDITFTPYSFRDDYVHNEDLVLTIFNKGGEGAVAGAANVTFKSIYSNAFNSCL